MQPHAGRRSASTRAAAAPEPPNDVGDAFVDGKWRKIVMASDGSVDKCLVCASCDACGHSAEKCNAYQGKRRGELYWAPGAVHMDAVQPSRDEISKHIQASRIPDIEMKARVEPIDGSGLMCFYLSMVTALGRLPMVRTAPPDAPTLIRGLAKFLASRSAVSLKQMLQEGTESSGYRGTGPGERFGSVTERSSHHRVVSGQLHDAQTSTPRPRVSVKKLRKCIYYPIDA